jgi:periplasmic protein TonB
MILPDYRHKLNNAETLRGISPHTMKNNKADLRKQYAMVMHYSLIVSLILTICLLRFYPVVEYTRSSVYMVQEIIDIEQIEITRQQDRPPPPQRPPIVIEVPSDIVMDDLDFSWSELNIYDDAPPPRPEASIVDDDDDEHYFVAVEEMPEIIGGIASLAKNLQYPEVARRAGVQGMVYVRAYVDEEGIVQKMDIARGIGAGLDDAAMDAVSKVRFTPGKQRGVPKKVIVVVQVQFILHTQS